MATLNNLSPAELVTLANAIAILMAEDKSTNELNTLGNFIVTLGSIILAIAAQQQFLNANNNK